MLLSELASRLGLRLKGQDAEFSGLNTLENASDTEISFLSNPKYRHCLADTKALAVILAEEFAEDVPTALISSNPYRDFAYAASFFVRKQGSFSGISEHAVIHPQATVEEGCTIHPHAHVGAGTTVGKGCVLFPGVYVGEDCVIGEACILYPNAVVLAGTTLGSRCVLNAGAVLGTDGFGFVRIDGKMQKIPQIGSVALADGVDVGANSCVDRATLGATSIGKDSKIDNLVQLGHNVELGEQCLIISQVGIAGSTKVGNRVTMAGQAGIAGHIVIGDDVTIGPQAGVPKDIAPGVTGSGSPFMDARTYMRATVLAPKLPDLHKKVQQLEKELEAVKQLLTNRPDETQ
ncbi:UDP-3-O-(3-hydroxymyristoyl)glucosamine N-acyltransferase [Desulfovibrio sp. OttesenSCG-928-G15]|nr:UDP-3-O-(3-hydroxymyristoyl)glucosamine N-acyltransferase [Desulfovibrio sp. OttesenSCG-928-G15]